MSKYVRRIIPFGSGDIPAVQSWLEDMAEKGLFFKECGLLFAKFTRGEPKKMRYRLDFCDVVACDIPDEKKELYEQSGWQVVGDYNSDLVVVCTDEPDAPEIYTDPELLVKPLKKLAGKHLSMAIVFLIMALCTQLTPFLGSMWEYSGDMLHFFLNIKASYAVLVIIMSMLMLTEAIVQFSIYRRLRRLAADNALPTENHRSRAILRYVMTAAGVPLAIIWLVHWLCAVPQPLYDDASAVSLPTAEEIVQLGTYDRDMSFYETTDAFLIKKIGLYQSKNLRDSDGQLSDILQYRVEYYEAPTELFAKAYADKFMDSLAKEYEHRAGDIMNELSRVRLMGYEVEKFPYYRQEEYEEDGAEVFWQYWKSGGSYHEYGTNQLVIRFEDKVMEVYCDGNSDFYDHIPEYIACLKSAK